jgi:Na+/phosphate symporter
MVNPYSSVHSTFIRTLLLWLLSNLGGTLWLIIDFSLERLTDYSVALLVGLVAAMISLAIIPLVLPFFAIMTRYSDWPRRTMALMGVGLFFLVANYLLLLLLPVASLSGLLDLSLPYLGSAIITVLWLYGPAARPVLAQS